MKTMSSFQAFRNKCLSIGSGCVGCGYCCMKVLCFQAFEKYNFIRGRCPELYWNGEMYRCKAIEESETFALLLSEGEGCCANLNTWRWNVRERKDINDND